MLKRLCVVTALSLCACNPNASELERILRDYDVELARQQAGAQNLNELRREMDVLEQLLAAGQGAPPPMTPPPPPDAPHVSQPLPPPTFLDGDDSKRLRDQIARTEQRIRELDKIMAEINSINVRRAELQKKLQALDTRLAE